MRMLKNVPVHAGLRLKLFFQDKMTILVLFISVFSFLFCMADLNQGAEEKASIPIGLIDLDESVKSGELVKNLGNLETFSIKTGTFEELRKIMDEGGIRCILEIKEGYEESVYKGKYRNLINVYHEEGDNAATLVTDIVAGEMMYDICQAQAYLAYEKLPEGEGEKFSREEYEAYAASLIGGEDFDFAFEFRFVDGKRGEREQGVKNSLFYRQAVAAVAALLFALLEMAALSGVCLEKAQGIEKRRKMLGVLNGSELLGSMSACAVLSMLPAAVFAICVGTGTGEWEKIFPVFWTSVLFSVIMSLIYYILARAVKRLLVYQIAGTVLLIGFGICSFCSMVEGVLFPEFPAWVRWIPNCAYLRAFTGILT